MAIEKYIDDKGQVKFRRVNKEDEEKKENKDVFYNRWMI